jgi:3'-5' exoribonuclease
VQTIEQVRSTYAASNGREFQCGGRFAIVNCQRKQGKAGEFAVLELRDPTGSLTARCFDSALVEALDQATAVDARLRVSEFNGGISAVLQAFEPVQLDADEVLRYAGLDADAHAARIQQVQAWLDECDGTVYGDVLRAVFADEPTTWARFTMAPAAVRMHHAEPGGLVRHICEVGRAGLALLESLENTRFDRAYFIAGVLLHDIGKLDTYTAPPTIAYTAQGQLVEHQIYSTVRIARACTKLDVPASIQARLIHIVEQAHGAYRHAEWQDPLGVEAKALATADYFSSRLGVTDKEQRSADALDQLIASDSAAAAAVSPDFAAATTGAARAHNGATAEPEPAGLF